MKSIMRSYYDFMVLKFVILIILCVYITCYFKKICSLEGCEMFCANVNYVERNKVIAF